MEGTSTPELCGLMANWQLEDMTCLNQNVFVFPYWFVTKGYFCTSEKSRPLTPMFLPIYFLLLLVVWTLQGAMYSGGHAVLVIKPRTSLSHLSNMPSPALSLVIHSYDSKAGRNGCVSCSRNPNQALCFCPHFSLNTNQQVMKCWVSSIIGPKWQIDFLCSRET